MASTTKTLVLSCILAPLALGVLGFDYFKFVQQWPPSYCNTSNCEIIPKNFTIHGLWPDNFARPHPSYCQGTRFNLNVVNGFKRRMLVSWPNLRKPTSYRFWRNQWNKHGKCSEYVWSQSDYFLNALNYKDMFYLRQILAQSNINPGAGYTPAQVNSSIYGFTGNIPELRCTFSSSGVLQLKEVTYVWPRHRQVLSTAHNRV